MCGGSLGTVRVVLAGVDSGVGSPAHATAAKSIRGRNQPNMGMNLGMVSSTEEAHGGIPTSLKAPRLRMISHQLVSNPARVRRSPR